MGVGKNSNKAGKPRRRIRRRLRVERLTERRVLAAITGMVFEDANLSFQQEADEASLPGRLLYLDINDNAIIEAGEPFALGGSDGSFVFPDVADGVYSLRLYNGTDSQQQTFPFEAIADGKVVPVQDGIGLSVVDGVALALTDQTIEIANFETGESQSIQVGTNLTGMQELPDGTLIVIGGEAGGDTAWLVDPANGSVAALDLSGQGQSLLWSQLAIDGQGYGVAIEQAAGSVDIHKIDASNVATNGVVSTLGYQLVPAETQVITSASGGRSVFASDDSEGLGVLLWSNSTASAISVATNISDASALEAFDDASGLLVIRSDDGGVTVHDADANFATLQTLPDVTGPVALDAERDLLLTVTPESSLQVYDVSAGQKIADLAVDLGDVGAVSDLAYDGKSKSLVVLGNQGMASLSLDSGAHRVTVQDNKSPDPVSFGVTLQGENNAPYYQSLPNLETIEDTQLIDAAPGIKTGAIDPDDDSFVLVGTAPPQNGTVTVHPNGSLVYKPNQDFFGTDVFTVLAHDGRDNSGTVTMQVEVLPVPDQPTGIAADLDAIPENALPGFVLGPVEVLDVDLNDNHQIAIDDPRFVVNNGQLIFIGGGINFEQGNLIPLTVTVTDPDYTETLIENIYVEVTDANDPITDIKPSEGTISENDAGAFIVSLEVEDEDGPDGVVFTVDDDRFEVIGNELKLQDGVSLDYEAAPTVTVNVTANNNDGDSFTKPIEVHVTNEPEAVTTIELSNQTVMELSPGAEVGDVMINGQPPYDGYNIFVNDPRFEIVHAKLKLVDDQWVERSTQEEIQVTITAQDTTQAFDSHSQSFVIEVLENLTPYHNDDSPFDVDGNESISATDALVIINYLNIYSPGPVGFGDPGYGYDVNGDGFVTALDALLILNQLNVQSTTTGGTVGGEQEKAEGEQVQEDRQSKPERIESPSAEDVVLPQWIASSSDSGSETSDESYDGSSVPYQTEQASPVSYDYSVANSAIASDYDRVLDSLSSGNASEEFSQRVDEALQAVVRSNSIG